MHDVSASVSLPGLALSHSANDSSSSPAQSRSYKLSGISNPSAQVPIVHDVPVGASPHYQSLSHGVNNGSSSPEHRSAQGPILHDVLVSVRHMVNRSHILLITAPVPLRKAEATKLVESARLPIQLVETSQVLRFPFCVKRLLVCFRCLLCVAVLVTTPPTLH